MESDTVEATTTPSQPIVPHIPTPEAVKGIYMTACVASHQSMREKLVKLIDETELNTVVIDVKSFDGYLSFRPNNPSLYTSVGRECVVSDMESFIKDLHDRGIYVVGRVAVFQDSRMVSARPDLAVKRSSDRDLVWRDHKGIPWIDAGAREHWDYILTIAREAYAIGFDEINFDYIRFPSDGNMNDIYFPYSNGAVKSEVIESFFAYLSESLASTDIVTSADLFGMTTTNTDDLNIGQILEKALPHFDYISPMVYPSHYPRNFNGWGDPNAHPYDIVRYSMDRAVERTIATTTPVQTLGSILVSTTSLPWLYSKPQFPATKMRPWLQDNNYPVVYTAEMVRAQIQATYDSGLTSWMLWNAGNRYTRDALLTQ